MERRVQLVRLLPGRIETVLAVADHSFMLDRDIDTSFEELAKSASDGEKRREKIVAIHLTNKFIGFLATTVITIEK